MDDDSNADVVKHRDCDITSDSSSHLFSTVDASMDRSAAPPSVENCDTTLEEVYGRRIQAFKYMLHEMSGPIVNYHTSTLDMAELDWILSSLRNVSGIYMEAKLKLLLEEAEACRRAEAEAEAEAEANKQEAEAKLKLLLEEAEACRQAEAEAEAEANKQEAEAEANKENEKSSNKKNEKEKKKKDNKEKKEKKDNKKKDKKNKKDKDKNTSLSTTVESLQIDESSMFEGFLIKI